MTSIRFRACTHLVASTALLAATPAVRAEDPATVGVLATLGINAAAGKTTLGDSAGAIEAGIYGTEAFQQAGAIIASIVNQRSNKKSVLLVTRGETIDLISSQLIFNRLLTVTKLIKNECARPAPAPRKKIVIMKDAKTGRYLEKTIIDYSAEEGVALAPTAADAQFLGKFSAADLAGVAKIDESINGISLSVDDRMLVNAVLMNGAHSIKLSNADENGWTKWPNDPEARKPLPADSSDVSGFWVASEATAMSADPPRKENDPQDDVRSAYARLVTTTVAAPLHCPSAEGKAAIIIANGLITSLNTTDKGPSPLVAAIQADAFRARRPLILRLAVEQTGGTSMSRSGLLYTLGLPNAATVSAGLVVSFRLIDPAGGGLKAIGVVRCIARQSNIKKVGQYLEHRNERWSATQPYHLGDTVCDFRVSPA